MNCILIVCVVLPAVVGSSLIYVRPRTSSGVQLFGYFLMSTGPGGIPLLMSLVGANYKGVTKKMTMTARKLQTGPVPGVEGLLCVLAGNHVSSVHREHS